MEEEKYQKELFEFEQPKKSFSLFSDMLPRADFEGRVAITISLEKIVFISIGVVMAMVIVYALGVESGRSRIKSVVQAQRPIATPYLSATPQFQTASIPKKSILSTEPIATIAKPAVAQKIAVQNQQKGAAGSQSAKPFTILASTFAKIGNAETAASILTKQGFNVTLTYSAPYYRVCVGAYADKGAPDAKNDLIRVRRIYKDAMFKLR